METAPDFSENRVCQLLGIRYPIIQAGMVYCAGWRLASAVSAAGGLGILGAGSMDPELLRTQIQKVKAQTDKPFGVNVPLLYKHAPDLLNVIVEEGVQVVFSSAGNPKTYTGMLKAAGIKVVHVVASVKFARKAEEAGVDAVVAEGFEAGGHNGKEEITTFCLIPQVSQAVQIPVIAAGGIADGRGMLAAMALGASAVQVGTRFVATVESSAHPHFKEKVVQAGEGDTRLAMKNVVPVRLLDNPFARQVLEAEARGASQEEMIALLGKGRARKGMLDGDMEAGELEIGQISGMVNQILPAAEIVKEMLRDYSQEMAQMQAGLGRFGKLKA